MSDLILEHLKRIQSDLADIKTALADQHQQILGVRKQLNTLEADILRHEEGIAGINVRLDRIEKRLGLIEA